MGLWRNSIQPAGVMGAVPAARSLPDEGGCPGPCHPADRPAPPEYTAQMMPAVVGLSPCANAASNSAVARPPARGTH